MKAALVHPSFTRKAMYTFFETGTIVLRKQLHIQQFIKSIHEYRNKEAKVARIEHLRIKGEQLDFWCEALLEHYGDEDLEISSPNTLEIYCDTFRDVPYYNFYPAAEVKHLTLHNVEHYNEYLIEAFNYLESFTTNCIGALGVQDYAFPHYHYPSNYFSALSEAFFFFEYDSWSNMAHDNEDVYVANRGSHNEMPFVRLRDSEGHNLGRQIFIINLEEITWKSNGYGHLTKIEKVDLGVIYHLYHYGYCRDGLR